MYGEDTYQFLRIMDRSPKVKQIKDAIYVYRNTPTGVINSKSGIHEGSKSIFFNAIREMLPLAKTADVRNSILKRLQRDGYR